MEIGRKIKDARAAAGLTQEQAAEAHLDIIPTAGMISLLGLAIGSGIRRIKARRAS